MYRSTAYIHTYSGPLLFLTHTFYAAFFIFLYFFLALQFYNHWEADAVPGWVASGFCECEWPAKDLGKLVELLLKKIMTSNRIIIKQSS